MTEHKRGSKDFCRWWYDDDSDFCTAKLQGCSCMGELKGCSWPEYFNCSDSKVYELRAEDRLEAGVAACEVYR